MVCYQVRGSLEFYLPMTTRISNSLSYPEWTKAGRYHIDRCPVLCHFRALQSEELVLFSVNGIRIYHEYFTQPKPLRPKRAKISGFVMSNTVLRNDPSKAPNIQQQKMGVPTGRKGYTRCLACNAEIFAPNTFRHKKVCKSANNLKWNDDPVLAATPFSAVEEFSPLFCSYIGILISLHSVESIYTGYNSCCHEWLGAREDWMMRPTYSS